MKDVERHSVRDSNMARFTKVLEDVKVANEMCDICDRDLYECKQDRKCRGFVPKKVRK